MTTLRDEERDALAAHVERLAAWIKEHGWHPDTCDILDLDEQGCHKSCSCGLGAINDTPETSLARRDLLMKAEALEDQASEMIAMNNERDMCSVHGAAKHLQSVAAEYREQAEDEA